MAEDGEVSVPMQRRAAECPDCFHRAHWKTECAECGCADGPTRKRERDEEHMAGHADSARNTQPGFY